MDSMIKKLEKELLELKTAQGYMSTATVGYYTANLSAGVHQIQYADGDYMPLTFLYVNGLATFNISNLTTPEDNKQYFNLSVARNVQIISTRKILSVS